MRDPITRRDRWLALALLLTALLLAYLCLVHPWWTVPMVDLGGRIDTLQQRDLRARTQLRQAPEVQQRLRAMRAVALQPGFMTEPTAELATAALMQRSERAVSEASPGNRSCIITNRSPLSQARKERYLRASVQVRLRCGTPELAALLHSLESGSPRLFIDNLTVSGRPSFAGTASAPQVSGLDVSFDLYGYLAQSGIADAR